MYESLNKYLLLILKVCEMCCFRWLFLSPRQHLNESYFKTAVRGMCVCMVNLCKSWLLTTFYNVIYDYFYFLNLKLREKCPCLEFLWSVFSHIWTPYPSVFGPNAWKYGRKKLRIRKIFTQCKFRKLTHFTSLHSFLCLVTHFW